ncbi:MAG: hypothetical protein WDM81_04795 [Rhizomicrobium sp.]
MERTLYSWVDWKRRICSVLLAGPLKSRRFSRFAAMILCVANNALPWRWIQLIAIILSRLVLVTVSLHFSVADRLFVFR